MLAVQRQEAEERDAYGVQKCAHGGKGGREGVGIIIALDAEVCAQVPRFLHLHTHERAQHSAADGGVDEEQREERRPRRVSNGQR